MKNIVCSGQDPRWPPWAPRGGESLGVGAKGKKAYFHLLFQNQLVDFIQTCWGSSLGGREPVLLMWSMWPPGGPRGRAPKGKKGVNFKNLLLQTHYWYSQDMLYVDTFIYEEYILFRARPKMAPLGP